MDLVVWCVCVCIFAMLSMLVSVCAFFQTGLCLCLYLTSLFICEMGLCLFVRQFVSVILSVLTITGK